jgi:hypothetical protein
MVLTSTTRSPASTIRNSLSTTSETFERYADRSDAPQNAFYAKVRTGIYNACEETLRTGGLHTVALAPGAGKTQFTNSYIGAMIEDDLTASALVVVEQIATVKDRFETLERLMPGKVACWTSKFKTVERNKLRDYPVAVITHAAFMTADDELDEMARCWKHGPRRLTVVDERLKAAKTFGVSMRDLGHAKDAAYKADPEAFEAMKHLDLLITKRIDGHNRIDHLADADVEAALPRLAWFNTTKADRYAKRYEKTVGQATDSEIIGFARTLFNRCGFLSSSGNEVLMLGYRNDLRVTGPTLVLDATSLIDGINKLGLKDGRTYHTAESMGIPAVTYENLRCIIRKPPLQKKQRVANVAKKDDTATKYRDWMVEIVSNPEYLKTTDPEWGVPGQKALVVTKKAFTVEGGKYLPNWQREGDRPNQSIWQDDPSTYEKLLHCWNADQDRWAKMAEERDGFHWDLGQGRSAAVTYFGANTTGSNAWNSADTVFIFEADYPQRGPNTAEVQGWLNLHTQHRDGVLVEMPTIDTYNSRVADYTIGRLARSHGQLIPRGRCREFDEHGRCKPMLVVCGINDDEWLLQNWSALFPKAPRPLQPDANSRTGTYKDRARAFLSEQPAEVTELSAETLARHLGTKPWKDITKTLMTRRFRETTLPAIGWRYETPRIGRSSKGWFVRLGAAAKVPIPVRAGIAPKTGINKGLTPPELDQQVQEVMAT